MNKRKFTTKTLVLTAMLAAIAGVLMSFEISLPIFPVFYKIDFSDVPSIIALFTLGPVPAVYVELIKIVIKLVTVGTSTAYVGELANVIGTFLFVAPIWFIYKAGKFTDKACRTSLIASVPIRVAVSCCINAFITLPLFAKANGIDLGVLCSMFTKADNVIGFLILATIPFNLIKNSLNNFIGYLLLTRLKKLDIFKN